MRQRHPIWKAAGLLMLVVCCLNSSCGAQEFAQGESTQQVEVMVPTSEILRPFNGNDLNGFTRWLQATGPPGNARGIWMSSIECQLAQGCEGDIICIRGEDQDGRTIPLQLTSDTRTAADGRTRWQQGGDRTPSAGRQFWWSRHEVGFKELLDTRGADDVASPPGEWTKVECICDADRITIRINGTIVNECYDVSPRAGRILLEKEKNEIYFRNLEIRPLNR
ncbi:MAG: DUF1080 domain-containing protein, partial [Planctomycetota bacterium]|nr:DUF1080 domain-containing protein [Planctomycetota bacterium]